MEGNGGGWEDKSHVFNHPILGGWGGWARRESEQNERVSTRRGPDLCKTAMNLKIEFYFN